MLGDIDHELVLLICSSLAPQDLGRLGCVARWFARLIDEAARRWVLDNPPHHARPRVWAGGPRCWLRQMHAVQAPLQFTRNSDGVRLCPPGCQCRLQCKCTPADHLHLSEASKYGGYGYLTAAAPPVMRRGRHCAEFVLGKNATAHHSFGVIRPEFDVEGRTRSKPNGANHWSFKDHCFYHTDGTRMPCYRKWDGMQRASREDRITLLLDLDAGSMTVYKNGEELGVMATGLSGRYSWATVLANAGDSVRIAYSAPPPVSGITAVSASATSTIIAQS